MTVAMVPGKAAQERHERCIEATVGSWGGFLGKVLSSRLGGILGMHRNVHTEVSYPAGSGNLEHSEEGPTLIGIRKYASGCVIVVSVWGSSGPWILFYFPRQSLSL